MNRLAYWYQLSVNQGNKNAQTNLGYLYENGYGVEQDYGQAAYWYQLSANEGNKYAQNNLGYLYENGYGVEQDYEQAKYWATSCLPSRD